MDTFMPPAQPPTSLSLREFISLVKKELVETYQNREPSDLSFLLTKATVEVEVNMQTSISANGGFKFVVGEVGAGAASTNLTIHKLTLELDPQIKVLMGHSETRSSFDA
jgi:hypothetical protein